MPDQDDEEYRARVARVAQTLLPLSQSQIAVLRRALFSAAPSNETPPGNYQPRAAHSSR